MPSSIILPTEMYGLLAISFNACALLTLSVARTSVATCLTHLGLPRGVMVPISY